MPFVNKKASMAELVDAADSKSALSNRVLVQVRLEVPIKIPSNLGRFFFLFLGVYTSSIKVRFGKRIFRNLSNFKILFLYKSICYSSSSPTNPQELIANKIIYCVFLNNLVR